VLAHTFGEDGFPAGLLDPALDIAAATLHGEIRHWVYASNEGAIHEMIAPIMDGSAGVVRLGLTEARLQTVVNTVTGQMILTTLLVALAGIVAAMFLTWLLTRPILDLVATTKEIGSGNLQARAPHWADDEIGALADAFNQMVDDLDASQRAVADKEQRATVLLQEADHGAGRRAQAHRPRAARRRGADAHLAHGRDAHRSAAATRPVQSHTDELCSTAG
jgi:HAMP domain-containing protein